MFPKLENYLKFLKILKNIVSRFENIDFQFKNEKFCLLNIKNVV